MSITVVGDESGSDGENLSNPTHQIFSYGTMALSVTEAADLIAHVRRAIGSTDLEVASAGELKSAQLLKKHRSVAEDLFEPSGPLYARASIYLADKAVFLAGKMVSLLIEEHQHNIGKPIPASLEPLLAQAIYDEALPALDTSHREALLNSFNKLGRFYKAPFAPKGRAQAFVDALEQARENLVAGPGLGALDLLWEARDEAFEIEKDVDAGELLLRQLDPVVPTLFVASGTWNEILDSSPFTILMDEYRQVKGDVLDVVVRAAQGVGISIEGITQVASKTDPRVQVADWIAGCGRLAATEVLSGSATNRLQRLVRPFIDENSMYSPASHLQPWLNPAP